MKTKDDLADWIAREARRLARVEVAGIARRAAGRPAFANVPGPKALRILAQVLEEGYESS